MISFFKNLRFEHSLYKQLVFIWFAFFVLVASSVAFINYIESSRLTASSENLLSVTQKSIEADLLEPEVLLNSISYTIRRKIMNEESAEYIEKYMKDISNLILKEKKHKLELSGIFGLFEVFDDLYIGNRPDGYIPQEQLWYKAAIEADGEVAITPPYKSKRLDSNYAVDYTQRIFDDKGKPLGIIYLHASISSVAEMVVKTTVTKEGGFGIILDSQLNFIAHPKQDFLGMPIYGSPIAVFAEELKNGRDIYEREVKDYENEPSIFFIKRMKNGWYIGITTPKSKYFKPVREMTFAISLLGLLLATVFSFLFFRIAIAKIKADERAKIMLDSTPLCATFWDKNYNVIDCNQEAIRLFELSSKQEFLDRFSELSPETQPDGSFSAELRRTNFKRVLEEGYSRFEWMYQKLNGEPIPAEVTLVSVNSRYSKDNIILGYIRDLREFKAMINEMRRIEIAEESNRAKSRFLAAMSHEIRTPMNAILGITEIQLQNETLPSDAKEALDRIYNSGYTLLGIINDILDLSKIEAGRMELVHAEYETASLINNAVQLNILRVGSKLIDFGITVDENIPLMLLGDELRIKQILNNLLSNAFKYTKEGSVNLSIYVEPGKNDSEVILIFQVSDTGIGMTAEQVSRLFEEYSRFNLKANRATEGTGLGMNITKRLVDLMKGEIFVESEPNKGTAFTVRLPQEIAGSNVLGKELAENLQKFRTSSKIQMNKAQIVYEYMPYGRVLIVDDVETNLYVAKGLMLPYGLYIDVAISGPEAIEKIREGKVYDIIFLDHMMPEMDGVETIKIIRDLGYSNPIIALTANAIAGQADMFLQNGFDDFIPKPIDMRLLNAVLNKFIRDKQSLEVIEEARKKKNNMIEVISPDSEIFSVFIRDAKKTLATLDKIFKKQNAPEEGDMQIYIINVHAMKSALANIGESGLSAFALKLEQAGRKQDIAIIKEQTPKFLHYLRLLIEKVTPEKDKEDSVQNQTDEDNEFLQKKLIAVRVACESYNKKSAKDALMELKQKNWSLSTREFLDTISEHLLYGDYGNVVEEIGKYLAVK